jgi:5-carboxymethyl-2-hydroxymuconate isomerase
MKASKESRMPHLTIEYSANLEARIDIAGLCRTALKAACSTGVLELGAARVRAVRCDHYAIADEVPENMFVDAVLRVGEGRSQEQKAATGGAIYDAMHTYCAALYDTPHFALSLEVREIDRALSWKRNGIKGRLQTNG